ncbi:hypothetical protein AUJ46_01205 [Candidatus Peregrinibacteria bacterium CG1_02_54_53]|nr:MAG: hypothetical protein AUJ46_01205 [Candidatus Peregrinibacteria bacterium CG1_02_54_53]
MVPFSCDIFECLCSSAKTFLSDTYLWLHKAKIRRSIPSQNARVFSCLPLDEMRKELYIAKKSGRVQVWND